MKISDTNSQKRTQQQIFLSLANPVAIQSQYSRRFLHSNSRIDNHAGRILEDVSLFCKHLPRFLGETININNYSPRTFGEAIFTFLPHQTSAEYVYQHILPLQMCWEWPLL